MSETTTVRPDDCVCGHAKLDHEAVIDGEYVYRGQCFRVDCDAACADYKSAWLSFDRKATIEPAPAPTGEAQPVTQEGLLLADLLTEAAMWFDADSGGSKRELEHRFLRDEGYPVSDLPYLWSRWCIKQRRSLRDRLLAAARTPAPAPEWVGEYRRWLESWASAHGKDEYERGQICGARAALNLLDRLAPSSPAQTENAEPKEARDADDN